MTSPSDKWPAERFYWAVLDAPGYRVTGPVPVGLLPALADEIPEPLDMLHAVATPVLPGHAAAASDVSATHADRLLICACRTADLAALDPSLTRLSPAAIPSELNISADPTALNLLTGAFEPPALRTARRHRHALTAATLLLCSALLSFGLVRRAHLAQQAAHAARSQADGLVSALSPDRKESSLIAAALTSRDLAATLNRRPHPRDAAADVAALLTAWPRSTPARPQSLAAAAGTLSLAVTLEGDAAPFLAALRPPDGFVRDEPRIASLSGITRVNLQFHPGAALP